MAGIVSVTPQTADFFVGASDGQVNELVVRVQALVLDRLDEKLAQIALITDKEKNKCAFIDLTNSNIEPRDLLRVVVAFDNSHRTSPECNAFIFRAADTLIQTGDLATAREVAMKMVCGQKRKKASKIEIQRNTLLNRIAEASFERRNFVFVYDCIAPIEVRSKVKNVFLIKLGDAYLETRNYVKALDMYRQIDDYTFSEERENCLGKLAICCITNGDWKYAEYAIRAIVHDENAKASLLTLLVDCCQTSRNLDAAFMILSHFITFETTELREAIEMLYCPIFKAYRASEDLPNAKKCIHRLLYLILQNEFSMNGVDRSFKRNVEQCERITKFSLYLAEKFFDEITRAFIEGDSEYVICFLRSLVSKHSSLETFKEYFKVEEDPSSPKALRSQYKSRTEAEEEKIEAYKLFELQKPASLVEVKKQFNKLRLQYHPDKVVQLPTESNEHYQKRVDETIVMFHKIKKAYDTIMAN
ncbi:MAG: J domain-containing protein [Chlamydiales bacterium]|nr:J domain-containing protein [Chlamydiales bacterium]